MHCLYKNYTDKKQHFDLEKLDKESKNVQVSRDANVLLDDSVCVYVDSRRDILGES